MTRLQYINAVCPDNSKQNWYLSTMKDNFIVMKSSHEPLSWAEGLPVVYGDIESAELECLKGETIITEEEFYNKHLTI